MKDRTACLLACFALVALSPLGGAWATKGSKTQPQTKGRSMRADLLADAEDEKELAKRCNEIATDLAACVVALVAKDQAHLVIWETPGAPPKDEKLPFAKEVLKDESLSDHFKDELQRDKNLLQLGFDAPVKGFRKFALGMLAALASGDERRPDVSAKLLVRLEVEAARRSLHVVIRPGLTRAQVLAPIKESGKVLFVYRSAVTSNGSTGEGLVQDKLFKPGAGSSSVIAIDPELTEHAYCGALLDGEKDDCFGYPGVADRRPAAVVLGHELIHALHALTGRLATAIDLPSAELFKPWSNSEELRTILGLLPGAASFKGMEAYDLFNENELLLERGHRLRYGHTSPESDQQHEPMRWLEYHALAGKFLEALSSGRRDDRAGVCDSIAVYVNSATAFGDFVGLLRKKLEHHEEEADPAAIVRSCVAPELRKKLEEKLEKN